MPSYEYDKFSDVYIQSSSKVLKGQKHRSSMNYDLREMRRTAWMKWSCPEGISFDVMEDKSCAKDPVTFRNVVNGMTVEFPSVSACNGLYIANPKYEGHTINQNFNFEIKISAAER